MFSLVLDIPTKTKQYFCIQKTYIKCHSQVIESFQDTYFLLVQFRQPIPLSWVHSWSVLHMTWSRSHGGMQAQLALLLFASAYGPLWGGTNVSHKIRGDGTITVSYTYF